MKDNFSRQANSYAKYRPDYPQALFDFIFRHVNKSDSAWDCAAGNGQSAKVLASHFQKVFASDISQKQIDQAVRAENIFSFAIADMENFTRRELHLARRMLQDSWFGLVRADFNGDEEVIEIAAQPEILQERSEAFIPIRNDSEL